VNSQYGGTTRTSLRRMNSRAAPGRPKSSAAIVYMMKPLMTKKMSTPPAKKTGVHGV
jgi:hypothetical protein